MSIERKYQVFVSSTYNDLQLEREWTQRALLETECIPMGMELFPPSDETQWEYIKKVIDQCDYYILILAGRYGSTDSRGLSYTEKEYRYAESIQKPIITFFHRDPTKLPQNMVEESLEKKKKLEAFRERALSKLSKPYENEKDLYGRVISGINHLKILRPDGGWIPAKYLPTDDVRDELKKLRDLNADLRKQLEEVERGKGSLNAIDTKPNHVAAREWMSDYTAESLRTADKVSIKAMAVSLHYTWDFFETWISEVLANTPPYKKLNIELEMVAPSHLENLGLKDWARKGRNVEQAILSFLEEEKKEGGLITSGRLELSVYQYQNIPHWHGMLINNHYLFLGRTRWTVNPERSICTLSVGEELYRLFALNDNYGGADRIAMFNSWFDYYKYIGNPMVSELVRESE